MMKSDEINHKLAISLPHPKDSSGVYLLYLGSECIYVGKTKNFFSRIIQHTGKEYSSVEFIHAPMSEANSLEAELIFKLSPRENKSMPGKAGFVSQDALYYELTKKGVSIKDIATICSAAKPYLWNGKTYYRTSEIKPDAA